MTKVVVVTGLSGSGKTLALRALEDLGHFAVDNLPVALIPAFVELLDRGRPEEPWGAFVVDAREFRHAHTSPEVLSSLAEREDVDLTVIFLEAREETLIRRFSESRRPHPLAKETRGGLAEAIRREQELLADIRALANLIVATDDLSPHDLRQRIQETIVGGPREATLRCEIISFGFKYGAPRDLDMSFDVRFLPNPYFEPHLRPQCGSDAEVLDYLERLPDYTGFLERVKDLLTFLMPRFVAEGKSYLNIGIGCTGGRHRSVAVAGALATFLEQSGFNVTLTHRDLERDTELKRA